ncbi:MAG TPA: hypothetical protein VK453_18270 [Micromonosporaceae bacterium]|nr:hypothetical protein [Micromonosporaceae bacterium]
MSRSSTKGTGLFSRLPAIVVASTAATALVVGVSPSPAAAAPVAVSSFSYSHNGAAATTLTAPEAEIKVKGTAAYLNVQITTDTEGWDVSLAAPQGESLRPGVFRNAERAAFRTGRAPGLDVSGNGSGCNEVFGQFTVDQIETDATGVVTVLDVRYSQRCEGATGPLLSGRLRYRAYPLSYRFVSDPGDYVGGGITKSYANSNSVFSVRGTASRLVFTVSGLRDYWRVDIAPKEGETLAPGTYSGAQRFADGQHPELDVSGDGRGCNQTAGSFVIKELVVNEAGEVTALSATFVQHCEQGTPALRGTIHYYA